MNIISVKEYAAMRAISTQAVTAAIRKGYAMPGIIAIERWGRVYRLTVDKRKLKNN